MPRDTASGLADRQPTRFLEHETRALLTRLNRIQPFALQEVMVPAASIAPVAQAAIDGHLSRGRRRVRAMAQRFLARLQQPVGHERPTLLQRRYALLRLQFNAVLTQFDLFADALSQRSERDTGVWLSGLDVAAADALAMPEYYEAPPVICYLDRGIGAAIRRARTRLPGGGANPVAVIRVPRERMVGSGIASSLVHEVGHQGAALLGLVDSLRPVLQARAHADPDPQHSPWRYWARTVSEIVADSWSVARVGIASTVGLIGVVSLPRPFVFRIALDDPHPFPWIRVLLSCAIGKALYPHPQWDALVGLWRELYPADALAAEPRALVRRLEAGVPPFVELLLSHQPARLRGAALREAFAVEPRQPARLTALYARWQREPQRMFDAAPTLAFAALGQARADGRLSPEQESRTVSQLLVHWALRSTRARAATAVAAPVAAPKH